MAKHWRIHGHDPQRIAALSQSAGVSAVVAQLLICRGLEDPGQARSFLEAKLSDLRPPEQVPGTLQAAELLLAAIAGNRRIVVYGDYDVDGMTGTALLWQCLKLLGGNAHYYVPHRLEEGYGLNDDALHTLAREGAQVVVTVDCGIASLVQAETAAQLGLELIITDHHEFAERLPRAAAIVHPRLPGTNYPFSGLSGSGVALKLAWALCQQAAGAKRVTERMRNFLLDAVALAALGTVADMVPLVDENRVLVQYGLASLKERAGPGLLTLMRLAELERKPILDCEDLGFALAPRLNAAGRLGQAQLGVELLVTSSTERAVDLAEYINELNSSRQSLERSIYLAALKQAQENFDLERDPALVLADHGWHPGVIGIVAGRLAEKFCRPVVLIGLDTAGVKPGIGSARSVPGFNLHQALAACTEHLLSHGGHAAAAGLKIEEHEVDAFREAFCEVAAAELVARERQAELWIDAELPLGTLTLDTVSQIDRLAPFGHSNRRPMFWATGISLSEPPRRIGGGGRHLSMKLAQCGVCLRAVAFGGGDWIDEMTQAEGELEIAFRPVINDFRGRRSVELQIADWRVGAPLPVAKS
ncbi:MAG TPA: single-stranded-DNA-specific exonuclease RecJ [Pirellulales bacterium]|jgi:single-stranded-DNA-specific exonuclease|nr:single-stranded-DNA-specific exonuclease RecJ [Pirellulales bacterium]